MTADRLAWRIEETCFAAFPALTERRLGNWRLRFSAGLSRRANSVNPLSAESPDMAERIAAAEALYRAEGLPAIFRVPSIAGAALDQELARRGYTSEGESCVLYGAIDRLAASADPALLLLPAPERRWLRAMARLQHHTAGQAAIYRRIVGAIAVPARFALFPVEGMPTALAYGAIDDGLLCYESVITDPRRRRRGLARRVIAGLAAWAREEGAAGACLQVEAANEPARALYAAFGLAELYRYHYRRAPPQSRPS